MSQAQENSDYDEIKRLQTILDNSWTQGFEKAGIQNGNFSGIKSPARYAETSGWIGGFN
jgi:hypothetical protein